ncbi:flagellar protein FliT [Burkholderia sp. PU8-34]
MKQAELIDRLNVLTDAIEHAVAMADWAEAARLAEVRSPLVMSLSTDQPPAGIAAIRRVHASNARIFTDARVAQQQLTDEYQAAMGRVQAVGEYHHMARL